jgi:hypothetical protein
MTRTRNGAPTPRPGNPASPDSPPPAGKNPPVEPAERPETDEHEGAVEEQVGDTTGPGVGYDQEPEQEKDEGGVGAS